MKTAVAGAALATFLAGAFAQSAGAVLVYERPASREIVAARDDGSRPKVIARGTDPVVAPDGRHVGYIGKARTGGYDDLRIVPINGGHAPRYTGNVFAVDPTRPMAWSPDSRYIAICSGSGGVFVVRRADRKRWFVPMYVECGWLTFAPDSKSLLAEEIIDGAVRADFIRVGHREVIREVNASRPVWGRHGFAYNTYRGGLFVRKSVRAHPRRYGMGMSARDWSQSGNTLLAIDAGSTRDTFKAVLVDRKSGHAVALPQEFDVVDALSRDGTTVLGEIGGNVVAEKAAGLTRVLAVGATHPTWTR